MSELSQNINIRTTHEMKKKIMDESHRVSMNMSEYILFSIEDYWILKDSGTTFQTNNAEQLKFSELLSIAQTELLMAKNEISQLLTDKNSLTETLHSQKNSIW